MIKLLIFIGGFLFCVGLKAQKIPDIFIIQSQSRLDSFVKMYPKLTEYKVAILH